MSESSLRAASFHVSGVRGKGSGQHSDVLRSQVVLSLWPLPHEEPYDCLHIEMNVSQTGFIIMYSF